MHVVHTGKLLLFCFCISLVEILVTAQWVHTQSVNQLLLPASTTIIVSIHSFLHNEKKIERETKKNAFQLIWMANIIWA